MNLSRYEKETIITFNEQDKTATVYTYNEKFKRKLCELCKAKAAEIKQTGNDLTGGLTFELPKKWVKINAGKNLTDKQRNELSNRMKRTQSILSSKS